MIYSSFKTSIPSLNPSNRLLIELNLGYNNSNYAFLCKDYSVVHYRHCSGIKLPTMGK